jgi:hypothetical protein
MSASAGGSKSGCGSPASGRSLTFRVGPQPDFPRKGNRLTRNWLADSWKELVRRLSGGSDPLSIFVMMPPPTRPNRPPRCKANSLRPANANLIGIERLHLCIKEELREKNAEAPNHAAHGTRSATHPHSCRFLINEKSWSAAPTQHLMCGRASSDQLSLTANPRWTPGRAIMASYQRFTFGYEFRSTLCRSWRHAHPRMAKSAIEIGPAKYS